MILRAGEAHRIHSVVGLFDAPLVTGVFDGSPVTVPMGTVSPPQPNGDETGVSDIDDPHESFGAFIVTHGGCA